MSFTRVNSLQVSAVMLALALACPAFACLNTFQSSARMALQNGNADEIAGLVDGARKAYAKSPTLENSNDLGAVLVMGGKLDEAIVLLREAEKKFPGSAKVAANLGTALELKGENDEALHWIREAVNRDANEHQGSEWLHIRFLDAKIGYARDPKWFEKNHILDLDFGKDEVPVAPEILPIENGKVKGADQLIKQIDYQLAERTIFVKPPDIFVGDLYASRSDLIISAGLSVLDQRDTEFEPIRSYNEALKYGPPNRALVEKRLARYKADLSALPAPPPVAKKDEAVADYPVVSKRFDRSPKQTSSLWIYLGAAVGLTIVLVAIGAFFDRRRRKRLEANPPPPIPDIDY